MAIDPNQIIDSAAQIAKDAAEADKASGSKKILVFAKSKAFWANVIGVAGTYFQYIPSKYAPYVLTGVNVILHYLGQ